MNWELTSMMIEVKKDDDAYIISGSIAFYNGDKDVANVNITLNLQIEESEIDEYVNQVRENLAYSAANVKETLAKMWISKDDEQL